MTHYDPFAYGEAHLDPQKHKGSAPLDLVANGPPAVAGVGSAFTRMFLRG